MGLNHPDSLDDWRQWARPSLARRTVARLRGGSQETAPELRLLTYGTTPSVLAALDSATLSGVAAGLRPLAVAGSRDVAVLCPPAVAASVREALGDAETDRIVTRSADLDLLRGSVKTVLSLGHYLSAGAMAYDWAVQHRVEYAVVQHGLLTPFAPPLPPEATLYAFSSEDGAFWAGKHPGRSVRIVGSQMLWEAAQGQTGTGADSHGPTVFLGQLHGRELGRWPVSRQTMGFLRANPQVLYRPHPAEQDALSRATHRLLKRAGAQFEVSGRPLPELAADVVALFSTGVIEAAAQGRGGWVHHTAPPAWLGEFWDRYGMVRWAPGLRAADQPTRTAPPDSPAMEPARAIARDLFGEETA